MNYLAFVIWLMNDILGIKHVSIPEIVEFAQSGKKVYDGLRGGSPSAETLAERDKLRATARGWWSTDEI